MPTAFDSKFRSLALRMLEAYGADGLYKSLRQGTYDTAEGVATTSYDSYEVKTLLSSSSRGTKPGTEARDDSSTALVAGASLPVVPKVGDVLVFDGTERRVVRGVPTYSGEQIALWQLQLAN